MTMLSMKARRSGTRAKGFSLLEVLIAIVVLSVELPPNAVERSLSDVLGLTPAAWLIRSKKVNRRCGAFSTQFRLKFVPT